MENEQEARYWLMHIKEVAKNNPNGKVKITNQTLAYLIDASAVYHKAMPNPLCVLSQKVNSF